MESALKTKIVNTDKISQFSVFSMIIPSILAVILITLQRGQFGTKFFQAAEKVGQIWGNEILLKSVIYQISNSTF